DSGSNKYCVGFAEAFDSDWLIHKIVVAVVPIPQNCGHCTRLPPHCDFVVERLELGLPATTAPAPPAPGREFESLPPHLLSVLIHRSPLSILAIWDCERAPSSPPSRIG